MNRNELTAVSNAASAVSTAFNGFISCVSAGNGLRKQKGIELNYALKRLVAVIRIKDYSDLCRMCEEEMMRTIESMSSNKDDPYMYVHVGILKSQYEGLQHILHQYMYDY